LKGLSPAGVGWAFTHVVNGHWHPLTVMVLMLDSQIFGRWAGGFHLVNISLHAMGVMLLFLLLFEMTGAMWRSAFVAAVFAIHPLRAESVAWVSECKDVLSGVFFMLTVRAYVRYARDKGSYAMMMLWLALGLMSKPMLVTTPCVLLLLDYWPLGRLKKLSDFPRLLFEKMPLLLLAALSSMAAVLALKAGNPPVSTYPANPPIAYVTYLWKLIYPSHLALLYPIPQDGWAPWEVFDAIVILAGLSAAVYLLRSKRPYLITGWLWYLGMLVPVAGVMQTGDQAYADRYTYLPQIGILFAVTWLAADWVATRESRRTILGVIAGAIICILAVIGWRQVGYWQNSETIWTHTIESTQDNWSAHGSFGDALNEEGRLDGAIDQYAEALRLKPDDFEARMDLGDILLRERQFGPAIEQFREVLRTKPAYAEADNNLGNALSDEGRTDEAIAVYRQALKLDPAYPQAHNDLGNALLQRGRIEEATGEFEEAVRLKPDYAEAHNNLAYVYLGAGRAQDAIEECREALRIDPSLVLTHNNLATGLFRMGKTEEAIDECKLALGIDPGSVDVQSNLAWILATAEGREFRDGGEALRLASSANEATGGNIPAVLRSLAAAYAQTGDFANARQTAQRALQLAGNGALADELRGDMKDYKAGRAIPNGR